MESCVWEPTRTKSNAWKQRTWQVTHALLMRYFPNALLCPETMQKITHEVTHEVPHALLLALLRALLWITK